MRLLPGLNLHHLNRININSKTKTLNFILMYFFCYCFIISSYFIVNSIFQSIEWRKLSNWKSKVLWFQIPFLYFLHEKSIVIFWETSLFFYYLHCYDLNKTTLDIDTQFDMSIPTNTYKHCFHISDIIGWNSVTFNQVAVKLPNMPNIFYVFLWFLLLQK